MSDVLIIIGVVFYVATGKTITDLMFTAGMAGSFITADRRRGQRILEGYRHKSTGYLLWPLIVVVWCTR